MTGSDRSQPRTWRPRVSLPRGWGFGGLGGQLQARTDGGRGWSFLGRNSGLGGACPHLQRRSAFEGDLGASGEPMVDNAPNPLPPGPPTPSHGETGVPTPHLQQRDRRREVGMEAQQEGRFPQKVPGNPHPPISQACTQAAASSPGWRQGLWGQIDPGGRCAPHAGATCVPD